MKNFIWTGVFAFLAFTPPTVRQTVYPVKSVLLDGANVQKQILDIYEVKMNDCSFYFAGTGSEIAFVHNPKCTNHTK